MSPLQNVPTNAIIESMDQLLSTAEAADACGVVPATITRWVESGKLVPVHKGKGLRGAFVFRKSDVLKLKSAEPADQPTN